MQNAQFKGIQMFAYKNTQRDVALCKTCYCDMIELHHIKNWGGYIHMKNQLKAIAFILLAIFLSLIVAIIGFIFIIKKDDSNH